ncbi:hypothetical protein AXG93_2415s1300 [Marchantia polymorpha subsp. ruderalis]|uniref:Uncharacterized protein n=1 Tax=Marchantia polymorpha subsp. ruderalis TaxID=1480154 RepID=A0A176VW08_MARPO|nr:hypothetical protein AXG93_2415s1300 [Marchantia polymorpha subsp. ruderalis]
MFSTGRTCNASLRSGNGGEVAPCHPVLKEARSAWVVGAMAASGRAELRVRCGVYVTPQVAYPQLCSAQLQTDMYTCEKDTWCFHQPCSGSGQVQTLPSLALDNHPESAGESQT